MVFRKPYAFLIKNFKKIHIAMLVISLFIFIKLGGIVSFIRDYISFGTYNSTLEPFSVKTGIIFYLAIIIMIFISIALIILLKRKNKPWKIYIIYVVEYLIMLYGLFSASNFFRSYNLTTTVSGIIPYRDLLSLTYYIEFIVFILLAVRVLGIDIKKFDFNKDEEFLELSESDREEFEVSFGINIDRHTITRTYNSAIRNLKYFYYEHEFICNIIIGISIALLVTSTAVYSLNHKSYKQNEKFKSGLYQITITDSYITDKDEAGNVIEKGSKFVVVGVKIKNISKISVTPNLDRYHLMNGNSDKTYNSYYSSYFKDLGKTADTNTKISPNVERKYYMVYKVKDTMNSRRFVMYYQELGGIAGDYLRKIKLKLNDVSKIEDVKTYGIDEKITLNYVSGTKKDITFTAFNVGESFKYNRYYCVSELVCGINEDEVLATSNNKILYMSFTSSDFEGEEFIDFSKRYGKIKYIDKFGKLKESNIENAIKTSYEGKVVFIKISDTILESSDISIVYTLRNKRYTLKIK